jgi:hypothetical protein
MISFRINPSIRKTAGLSIRFGSVLPETTAAQQSGKPLLALNSSQSGPDWELFDRAANCGGFVTEFHLFGESDANEASRDASMALRQFADHRSGRTLYGNVQYGFSGFKLVLSEHHQREVVWLAVRRI